MALPEIKASDEVDCSPDSIKIVLSIRALISVANYNYVQSEGEEKRKDGNAMWHDRGVSSWARRRKIRDRREKILFLARECPPPFTSEGLRAVNEQATGPSLPGSPLHRFVRSRLLSHCVCLSIYRSFPVTVFFDSSLPFFTLKGRQKTRTFINLRQNGWRFCRTVSSSRFT